jgi:membrane-associated protease RseP (regulator of RpoE activity)
VIAIAPPLRRPAGLAALALALAGLAAWPWLVPTAVPARPQAMAGTAASAAALAPLPPVAAFAAMVERPLFAPSRRPEARAAAAAAAGPALASRYRLLGLVGVGAARKALLAEGARRFEVKEGDALAGGKVVRIEQDRLVLSLPGGEVALRLGSAATETPR